jgi:hypothetical protein
MSATWDEIKARSIEHIDGIGTCFCWDCDIAFGAFGLPCRKHATPEESAAIDEHLRATLTETAMVDHPLLKMLGRPR